MIHIYIHTYVVKKKKEIKKINVCLTVFENEKKKKSTEKFIFITLFYFSLFFLFSSYSYIYKLIKRNRDRSIFNN